MQKINVEDAVGTVLCHDLTQIIPGQMKDARFRKGHVIKEEDIPILLSMGKKHIYVYEVNENMLHEDDAALILRDICINEHMTSSDIKEGKIELRSQINGYLHIDKNLLNKANMYTDIVIATIKSGNVNINDKICGMRVVPLVIEKNKMNMIKEEIGSNSILKIYPYKIKKYGVVVTGSEVLNKLVVDNFSPVVINKLKKYDANCMDVIYTGDDKEKIVSAINDFRKQGAELICCTGGMSVDPDDMTPSSIIDSGANIITYGGPFLPGAMMLLGYYDDDTPIVGLPGCVMYSAATIFDVILPRIMAKIKWTREELIELGYGGLCKNCEICHFPNCTFGN